MFWYRIRTEPARVVAITLAILGVAASFGLGITQGQSAAIVALVSSALALIGGETVRAQVTPTIKIPAPQNNAAPIERTASNG